MSNKTIESRIVKITAPSGSVSYVGQLNYKRFFGLLNNWTDVTREWSHESNAKEKLERKKSEWEYRNNKTREVVNYE